MRLRWRSAVRAQRPAEILPQNIFSAPRWNIMPTILGLCRVPIPQMVEGVDYIGYLYEKRENSVKRRQSSG
jgi:hypothetical protein